MNRQRFSVAIVAVAVLALSAINHWATHELYSFGGHGPLLSELQRALLIILTLTHASLAGIMWTQRRRWDSAEASTFRFIAVKGIFWGFFAATFRQNNGIPLASVFLLAIMMLTAIDLDIHLFRRYVIGVRRNAHDR